MQPNFHAIQFDSLWRVTIVLDYCAHAQHIHIAQSYCCACMADMAYMNFSALLLCVM